MKAVLLRVGIDSGSGGIQGPLFRDGSFEFIPIPDVFGLDDRTYRETVGRRGEPLLSYFPAAKRDRMASQCIHFDPEFETFTYGDPTQLKSGLRRLEPGDLLLFYAGLAGWDFESAPALYLIGYFVVDLAGFDDEFDERKLQSAFGRNWHVMHASNFADQPGRYVLVKGGAGSRLLEKAVCISQIGTNRSGGPLKVLSKEMREIFGNLGGRLSIQRSPPRWIAAERIEAVADFVRSLV